MKHTDIISLVGMTGCGKSSVGRILAKRLNALLIDLDDEIVARHGTIKDIFAKDGEAVFRELEYSVLSELLEKSHDRLVILSTGGGAPTYEPSRLLLKEKSYVVWLRRGVDTIPKDSPILTRPPVNGSIENYKKLLGARYPIYRKTADMTVYNVYPQRTAAMLANKIKKIKEIDHHDRSQLQK